MERPKQKSYKIRKPHALEPTRTKARPKRVFFFDTETKQTDLGDGQTLHTIKLGVARYCFYSRKGEFKKGAEYLITSEGDFWQWVDMNVLSKGTSYLVGHNIVFDIMVLDGFKELALLGWELKGFYSKGMISIFRWTKGKKKLMALDNGNFFKGRLEELGKMVGLPKLEVDFDTVTDDDLLTYCRRDVEIMIRLWSSWLKFLDDHYCGGFKPTVASTAFNAWRYRFLNAPVYIHSDEKALSLARQSYRGGRTECLWVGHSDKGPFYYLDVNAMYAYVMWRYSFPISLWGYSENVDLYYLSYKLARYDVIAEVVIKPTEPWFPILNKTHTCYPVGLYKTTLTTPELKHCVDRGWLRDVFKISWYRTERIFQGYVETFRSIRKDYEDQGLKEYAIIAKDLINKLYGKFGQRGFKQECIGECEPQLLRREEVYDDEDDYYYTQLYIGGKIYREWQEGESYHSLPALPAHVTAYARMYLYGLVNLVPRGHVYYMDTDSLIVDQVGYDALEQYIQPERMGYLKVERSSPWLTIYAPKDYEMEGRSKRKGISRTAEQLAPDKYRQTHWLKLGGLMQAQVEHGYKTKTVEKTLKRIIYSGVVGPDGWIDPFVYPHSPPISHPLPHLVKHES